MWWRDWLVDVVQEALVGASVHRGTLPRVVVCGGSGHLSNTAHRCLDRLHNARHHLGTLSVCRQLGLLQQLGQGQSVFLIVSRNVVDDNSMLSRNSNEAYNITWFIAVLVLFVVAVMPCTWKIQ